MMSDDSKKLRKRAAMDRVAKVEEDLEPLFDGETLTLMDERFDYGEDPFITVGILNGIVLVVVHTETDTVIRFISARKGTKNEEKSYFKEIAD